MLQVFSNYQAARTTFVQTIAELANRPQNIEVLQSNGVLALLRPLLIDTVPSIQQSAALGLGRLANYSEALAENVCGSEILPQLVYSIAEKNVRFSFLLITRELFVYVGVCASVPMSPQRIYVYT